MQIEWIVFLLGVSALSFIWCFDTVVWITGWSLAHQKTVPLIPKGCVQCFDDVGWTTGRASGMLKLSGEVLTGVVICLEQGANDLYMVQLIPPPLHHLLLH